MEGAEENLDIHSCLYHNRTIVCLTPVTYRASAVVLPQADSKSNLGQLGSLASLAGVNLGAMMGDGAGIQPELYPNVVNSYPFLKELIHTPLNYEGEPTPISFYEKELADSVPGFGATVLKYTLKHLDSERVLSW